MLYFEPRTLIDTLINEVLQTPGALPLLSFTLHELYLSYAKNPDGSRALTEANYKKIGGVIGSLRRRINEEYEKFQDSPEYQETMRRILLRMVAFEGGELTRRQVPIWEFTYPDAKENERVEEIRKTLLEARLLVGNDNKDSDDEAEPYVEAAHDELIVAWDKLFEWRDKEGEKMLLHRQLTRAAADWKRGENEKERKALLWDNSPRLLRVQEFLEQESFGDTGGSRKVERKQRSFRLLRQFCKNLFPSFEPLDRHIWLNQVETNFVRRSVEKRRNFAWIVTTASLIFVSFLSAAAFIAWMQKEKAIEKEIEARHQLAMSNWNNGFSERDLNSNIATNSLHYLSKSEVNFTLSDDIKMQQNARFASSHIYRGSILLRAIMEHKKQIRGALFNRDETQILTWSNDGTARVWNSSTGQALTSSMEHKAEVLGAVFNKDETRILTWSKDGMARLWNSSTGRSISPPLKHKAGVRLNAVFNKDETRILTWSRNGTVRLWDCITGQEAFPSLEHKAGVLGAVFNKDETRILTWSEDGTARLWDSGTGGQALTLPLEHKKSVLGAVFNKDETRILTWSEDGTARLWDSGTGQAVFSLPLEHKRSVQGNGTTLSGGP